MLHVCVLHGKFDVNFTKDIAFVLEHSGGSRISKRRFPLVVDHRRRGLGAQTQGSGGTAPSR